MRDMHCLCSLQDAFCQALVDGDRIPEPGVFSVSGVDARKRLNIYLNNSRIMQVEALASTYPAIRRLVGADFFDNMSVLYSEAYPLSCGDLREVGSCLPEFIQEFAPLSALPYMGDVARLEWICHESMCASTQTMVRDSSSPARITVSMAPHARLLKSKYPIAEIWDFALREHASDSSRLDITNSEPCHLLVMRPNLDVEVLQVKKDEWEWLADIDVAGVNADNAGADEQRRVEFWLSRGALDLPSG